MPQSATVQFLHQYTVLCTQSPWNWCNIIMQ